MDLPVGEKLGKAFEAAYPGISVQIERSGSERLFQRVDQEFSSNIRAVDIINSSTPRISSAGRRTAGWRRSSRKTSQNISAGISRSRWHVRHHAGLPVVDCYNTNLVKPEDAPKSFADLLDPKWAGKMVKGHPAYSGTIMTATFQMVREFGWSISKSCQAARDAGAVFDRSAKKLALGERAVMRRQRIRHRAAEGGRAAGRTGLSHEGTPTIQARPAFLRPRRTRMPQDCSRPGCIPARPSSSSPITRRNTRFMPTCSRSPGAKDFRHQADEGGCGRRGSDGGRNQDALCAAVSGVSCSSLSTIVIPGRAPARA